MKPLPPRNLVFTRRSVSGSIGRSALVLALLLVAPAARALNPAEQPADYSVSHWDTENGLPHNSVKHIFQTRDGYLWIGTGYGLARFDGLTFTVFNQSNTPAFRSSIITTMVETDDGSLWIGTSSGIVRYLSGHFTNYGKDDGIKSETINALCNAPDGSLWICGREGITRWIDGKFINDIDTTGLDIFGMRTAMVDRRNRVWLAAGTQVIRHQDGVFTVFNRQQGLPNEQIQIIVEDSDGQIVAVTQGGLFGLQDGQFAPLPYNEDLSSLRISRALVDRDNNFWIGSVGGLDRYRDGQVVPYVNRTGRGFGVVDVLFEDREKSLWVGTSEGLYRLTNRRAYSLSSADGITGSLINALLQTRDGSLWISSWGNGVDRLANGARTNYNAGSPLSNENVTALYESDDGTIWLGNRGSSVDRLRDGKVTTYVLPSGVPSSRPVTAFLTDDDGTLLLGIANRGLLQLRDGRIEVVPEAAELNTRRITIHAMHRTAGGRLLLGTNAGIFERQPDRSWIPVEFPTLSGQVVVRNFLESNDTLWLATDGQGLVRWQKNQVRAYRESEGMLSNSLFSVLDDGLGSLWVGSARGIARIRKSELAELEQGAIATINSMTLGRNDGLLSASVPGGGAPQGIRLADGRLLFATDRGVAVIDPKFLQINPQPPNVVIESLLADDRPVPLEGQPEIAAGTGRLEFRFTALSLIAPERQRFRYLLEGSDIHWVEAGHDRRASYTHLPPGTYTFRVLASNNDGIWNETGAARTFTILPFFYQTLWFQVLVVSLLIAMIAALIWWRTRQLHRREESLKAMNAELDQRVRERTTELSQSHEELQQRERLFRLIFEHAPVGISWKRADLGSHYHFNPTFQRILDLPAPTLPNFSLLTNMLHPDDAPRQAEMARQIELGLTDQYDIEQRYVRPDGAIVWGRFSVAVVRDADGLLIQDIGILEDISARKQAEQDLAETNRNLFEVSRMAGMAEVATGVLHNVGNVLNSLNVSATVIGTGLRQSKADSLAKLSALLQAHGDDLGSFLTTDPKGRRLPELIASLATHSQEERDRLLAESISLQENVDHIKEIVSMQQSYSTRIGMVEQLEAVPLFEDALRMNLSSLNRHQVKIIRQFQAVPPVLAEKAKVLQILINLIRNAQHACEEDKKGNKTVTLGLETGSENHVRFVVRDTGVGIPAENLTRIFAHGFTTKLTGHGFGLHSAANAAKEMKGSLTARSDGPGCGATFILELPAAKSDSRPASAA